MEWILNVTKWWCVLTLWRLEAFTFLKYCTSKISSLLQTLWDNILFPLQGPSCPKRIMEQVEACLYMEQCYCLSAQREGNGETIQLLKHWLERQTSFWTISVDYGYLKTSFSYKLSSCLYVHFLATHMRKVTWLCTIWWTSICVSAVWCYKNHRNVKVEPSLCLERSNGTAPSQSEPCFVDCQWPCVLSQWTEWTSCTQACTTRTRTRHLIGESCSA